MNTIPACPPTPTLEELQSNEFVQVYVNELVPNEFVVLRYRDRISCVEIMNNTNDPNGRIKYRFSDDPANTTEQTKPYMSNEIQFYRKVNPRKHFDKFATEMQEDITDIRKYPEDQELTPFQKVIANKDMSRIIGDFLGPPTSGKGGRRKTKKTRRTRKNKRKSIRRIRGKKNNNIKN